MKSIEPIPLISLIQVNRWPGFVFASMLKLTCLGNSLLAIKTTSTLECIVLDFSLFSWLFWIWLLLTCNLRSYLSVDLPLRCSRTGYLNAINRLLIANSIVYHLEVVLSFFCSFFDDWEALNAVRIYIHSSLSGQCKLYAFG